MKKLLALLLALALAFGLVACGNPAADKSPSPSDGIVADLTQDVLTFAAGDVAKEEWLFSVNGEQIPASRFLYWLALSCSYFENTYGRYYGYSVADYSSMLYNDTCTSAAYYALLEQKAAENGCPLTDEQLNAIADEIAADETIYQQRKLLFGLSDEDMEFIYSVTNLYDNLLEALVPVPTEDDLNNYVYQARHILLLTVDMEGTPTTGNDGVYRYPALDSKTIAEKKALVEDIMARLRASDDPETLFNELMNKYSEDSGLATNPDGYTTTLGKMVPEFEGAALALEFGGISDIVESSYGYHIILRGEVEDLESYSDSCRQYHMDQLVDQWLSEAEIEQNSVLKDLDVADFYARYIAWQEAYMAAQDTED